MLYDVVVIGGGINGCGCAADAALRGLSVLLCEQGDLAQHTSSQSSKLIHGGLRYLEQAEFRLVHKALQEQRILLKVASHLVHPLAFVLPYRPQLRPAWLIRLGLFLYDHLSLNHPLPHSETLVREQQSQYFLPLDPEINKAFLFYDAQTEDARLTLEAALQAQKHGATILTRTTFVQAKAQNGFWQICLQTAEGQQLQIQAKALINAAGPWAKKIASECHYPLRQKVSYVKGSHMIVPAFYAGKHAYLLQASDKRVIFVIPYHGQLLIGTTDQLLTDVDSDLKITAEEIQYFKEIIYAYFKHKITDITTSWAGMRSLPTHPQRQPAEFSRDYHFECHSQPLPFITIVNGKLTTFRHLSAQIIDKLSCIFPDLPSTKTHLTPLPGCFWTQGSYADYLLYATKRYAWLGPELLQHYLQTYGTRTDDLLLHCKQLSDLGCAFGSLLHQKEIDFLKQTEWAKTAEDVLWRRTKLGLGMTAKERKAVEKSFCS